MSDGAPATMWRAILIGAAAIAGALVVLVLLSKTVLGWNGEFGWTLIPSDRPCTVAVASVAAHGPAAMAGMKPGDRIDLRDLSVADRTLILTSPLAGRSVTLAYVRGGDAFTSHIVATRTRMSWYGWLAYALLLWMVAFAGAIGWRRPAMPEARLLSLALSFYVAADAAQYLVTPSVPVDIALSAVETGGLFGAAAFALFVRFVERFGCPLGRARIVLDVVTYVAAGALAVFGIAGAVALAVPVLDPVPFFMGTAATVLICGAQVLVIASGVAAVAACRGADRQRVAWAVASMSVLFAAAIAQIVLDTAFPNEDVALATQVAVNVVSVFAPVGLTYAILSRRLLDIGFALNQAAVFSAVSLIVVGTFIAIEWALGNWLQNVTRVTSTLVSLVLALGLGFSIKALHGRVEHAMDRIFFRTRHEHEKALLQFAREAAFVTDAGVLADRTIDEIVRHTGATRVSLYRAVDGTFLDGSGAPPVDENDAAIVSLRASNKPVDLHRVPTLLGGEYAFPLIARGRLTAVLVCGAKRGGVPYAPDEVAAIAEVAREVGAALDASPAHAGETSGDLVALQLEVAALRHEVRELLAAMRSTGRA